MLDRAASCEEVRDHRHDAAEGKVLMARSLAASTLMLIASSHAQEHIIAKAVATAKRSNEIESGKHSYI
jgi:hypothetical protein